MKPYLYNGANNKKMEVAAPPLQPHKSCTIGLGHHVEHILYHLCNRDGRYSDVFNRHKAFNLLAFSIYQNRPTTSKTRTYVSVNKFYFGRCTNCILQLDKRQNLVHERSLFRNQERFQKTARCKKMLKIESSLNCLGFFPVIIKQIYFAMAIPI